MTGPALSVDDERIHWLLAGDEPAVRAAVLTELLGAAPDDREVEAVRRVLMQTGAVPAILAHQREDGHWGRPERFYGDKYGGTVWQLVILAELGADGGDARVRAGCEAILRDSQDPASGGFSMERSKRSGGGLHNRVIPCLTGNMVFSLVRLGMLEDPRVVRGVEWLNAYLRFDDGDGEAPTGWPYDSFEMCWGRHSCHMGVAKGLKALAAISEGQRSPETKRTLAQGAEYLLRHHVYKRSHDLTRLSKPGWRRFGFPRMYQTDVLEMAGVLTRLGYGRDERLREALELVAARAGADGRWILQDTFNDRFPVPIEAKGEPSRWLTLRALRVLKDAAV